MMTTAKAASLLAAARQLLAREDPKAALEARKSAEQALLAYQERGDEDGELEAMQELIMADLASKQPLEAVRMAKDKLFMFQTVGNKKGEAAMLLALACAHLAAKEPGPALDAAKKSVAAFQKLGDAKGEFGALQKAMVSIYIMSGEKKEAVSAANQALNIAKRLGESAKADATFAVMQARIASDAKDALVAAQEALALYKKIGDVKGQASTYSAIAEVHLSKKDAASAASAAKEAMSLYQDLDNSTCTAEALKLVVKAYIQSGEPAEALASAQQQLKAFKQKGDLKGEASTYAPLFFAHRSQEDQDAGANEALEMAGDALELLRQLGDRPGEASMWILVAETHATYGMDQVALQEAQEALMIYRDLKDKKGQDNANIVITEVYIRQGKPALAPLHGEGLELLGLIAAAIDERDGPAYQAANERMMRIGGFGLLTDTEQAAALSPVISRDPDACIEFMNANAPEGMEVDQAGNVTGPMGVTGTLKPHMYFGFRFGGIAYGPRYRCVEQGNKIKGLTKIEENDFIGMSVLMLQDHSDDWEVSLKLHPAILDCALQSTSCVGEYALPQGKKDDGKKKK